MSGDKAHVLRDLPTRHLLWSCRIDVGQDGRFVDVGIVFGVDVLQFRMERRIAGAGESGIAFSTLVKGSPAWKLV